MAVAMGEEGRGVGEAMSGDTALRALEREAATGDAMARYRYRCACVRAGVPGRAGIEIGDRVEGIDGALPPMRVLSRHDDEWLCVIHSAGNAIPFQWPESKLRLLEPVNPANARRLMDPQPTTSYWRRSWRSVIKGALESSYCRGWPLPEVRAYLASLHHARESHIKQMWAAEVGMFTGGVLGKGSRKQKAKATPMPLFGDTERR